MKYEAVIGLEIHCELKTKTKIFCGCATTFGAEQNTHVCPVCLGMPGVLPTVNQRVVEFGIKAGLATNCEINKYSKFDRKNYYYPDLPKNWQTSQYDLPIAEHGWVDIDVEGEKKRIRLTRIHMEEDAGKLVHSGTNIKDSASSNVDYNRTGVPLLEIVSEPDMSSAEEARAYMEKIKAIMEYIDVSNCRMEEGNLRADINVSLRPVGSKELGTRTEMKNINSFKNLESTTRLSARPRCWRTGAISCRRPAPLTLCRASPFPCAARKMPTTTAICRSRICLPSSPARRLLTNTAASCRSCPMPAAPAWKASSACPTMMQASSPAPVLWPSISMLWWLLAQMPSWLPTG